MALTDAKAAIGAVSDLLSSQLSIETGVGSVDIGRMEVAAGTAGPKFNLFLYQIELDSHLRNQPFDRAQPTPLWLMLKYLLTAYDADKDSNSPAAQRLLGEGMLALNALNFIEPASSALNDNPEPLKITFDVADAELLVKLSQNNEEEYRLSAAFQVRPVMVARAEAARPGLPIDRVGGEDRGPTVIPSLGPRIESLDPEAIEAGEQVVLQGSGLDSTVDRVRLDGLELPVVGVTGQTATVAVPEDVPLSAGSLPLTALRSLDAGHDLASNRVMLRLLPTVETVATGPLTTAGGMTSGTLNIHGHHLGDTGDAVFVALYRDGDVALLSQITAPAPGVLSLTIDPADAIPAGAYRVIVRTNGEQARLAPEVDWS